MPYHTSRLPNEHTVNIQGIRETSNTLLKAKNSTKPETNLSSVLSMLICGHLPVHVCTLVEVLQRFSRL